MVYNREVKIYFGGDTLATEMIKAELLEQQEYMAKIRAMLLAKGRPQMAYTKTYGCQQNENDTERIRGMLRECGYVMTDDEDAADIIIYNTCAVRENAEQKVFGRLGILKNKRENGNEAIICMCGCMAQQGHIAEKIRKIHPQVDLMFGTHALNHMPKLLYEVLTQKGKRKTIIDIEAQDGVIAEGIPVMHENSYKAWVSIMYGCNNFCSYCIVPYVRGRERSRRPECIIEEIKGLVANGCTEICLLGQNVNSYGKDLENKMDFADLLRMINKIDGIKRIRFMTSHPKDFGDRLVDAMSECDKVCAQLHLPFQAGNNRVLAQMNRGYTKDEYLEKIDKIKKRIPDIALSTDIIVGFPSETKEEFEDTIDVLKKVEFDTVFSFIYSKRVGTPAAKLDFVLTEDEIHENFDRLLDVQNEISLKKNKALLGKTLEVLVDGPSKTNEKILSARTDGNKVVNFEGPAELTGKYVRVKIKEAHTWNLIGEMEEN